MKARKLIKRTLKCLISQQFSISVDRIKEYGRFQDLGIYSFQLENLKPFFVDQMGIDVKKKELRDCEDLCDMTDLVLKKLNLDDDDEVSTSHYTPSSSTEEGLTIKDLYLGIKIIGLLTGVPILPSVFDILDFN